MLDASTGKALTWEGWPMVLPTSARLRERTEGQAYEEAVVEAGASLRLALVPREVVKGSLTPVPGAPKRHSPRSVRPCNSASVLTAWRRCGIAIEPPTTRPTLRASTISASHHPTLTHWIRW